jgi:hypothetical protein
MAAAKQYKLKLKQQQITETRRWKEKIIHLDFFNKPPLE